MKAKILILTYSLLFGFVCCNEKEREFQITENHELPACGIEDPLVNISWLADTIPALIAHAKKNEHIGNASIVVYKHKTEGKYLLSIGLGFVNMDCTECYSNINIYTCSKERLFAIGNLSSPNPEFEDNYEHTGILWSLNVLNNN